MKEITTKTIKIRTPKLPPEVAFIEDEIKKQGIEPLRYSIVDVQGDILVLSVSGSAL